MATGTESRWQESTMSVESLAIDGTTLTATAAEINAGVDGLTATAAELNRTSDTSARIVTTTATELTATVAAHGERVVLVNTNNASGCAVTLPAASGSGAKFTVINNIVQTQGSVVVAANGTDVLTGKALVWDSTATAQAEIFLTSATSDKVTFNRTTTGGLGYDEVVAYDVAANTWLVTVVANGSGSLATPFAAS